MSFKSQCHVQVKSQLPLHSAHEGLQNQHIPGSILREKGWGGTQHWLCWPFCFWWGANWGRNHVYRLGDSQQYALHSVLQIPAVYDLKMKHRFNWYGGLWNNLSSLNPTNFFYQPGWRITPSRCLMLTATQTNLFSCPKRSIIWNMIVFGHFSIFLVKSWWSIKSICAVSCVHRCAHPPIPMVPLWGQPSDKIRSEFFSTTYKAIF